MTTPLHRTGRIGLGLVATLTLAATGLTACSGSDDDASTPTTAAVTSAPTSTSVDVAHEGFPGADWEVSTPEAEGFDPAALEAIRKDAFAEGRNTQGIVIIRHGRIAAEWYAEGADADSWASSWSMAKSFTSALIGIAIDEGLIPSVEEPMTTWYPEWEARGLGDIRLVDLLQMADGLGWNESYDPEKGASDVISIVLSQDPQLPYVEALDAVAEPGTTFNYSSGTTLLLSGVLAKATGMSAGEYARQELFDPLQFSKADWWEDKAGTTLTYCCVDTTSRDFARLGLLYLHQGKWGDEQIVSSDWVKQSTTPSPAYDGYGYQWWLEGETDDEVPDDVFSAAGHDGQYIHVVPSLDLVIVRNGTYAKAAGPAVAEPSLFDKLPPDGYVPGKGTMPPDEWDDVAFIASVVGAIED